ncbi:MAG: DNA-processing protein DprA [Syntrophothermus sp.]
MSKLDFDDLVLLRLLLSVEGIGSGKIRNLLSRFKKLKNIFEADIHSLANTEGISNNLASRIISSRKTKSQLTGLIEEELKKLFSINARVITVWDAEFPSLLKKIYDPPLILYIKGELIEQDNYSISIVGTRMPTNYGKVQAERLSGDLASQGITIVSGLARGIDSIAHYSALKNNGRTIAVIGSGLDVIYPPENKKLLEEISTKGAVISEFPLGTQPDAMNFPKRNRIIAGISLGCIVIETAVTGGALQTAEHSLDQGKEVFAVPGNLGIRQSEGTNKLIQKGEAKLVTSAEDVLVELELKLKPIINRNVKLPEDLNLFEEKIINALSAEPLQIDKIASLTNLSTSDCLVHLLTLEFKGLIKQLPGKVFSRL